MEKIKKVLKKCFTGIIIFMLVFSQAWISYASEEDKQSLEEYLAELKTQIEDSNAALDDIYVQMDNVNNEIAVNDALLADEQESMETQKADMAKRIQYMYEAGSSMVVLAAILSAESLGDILNQASYINELVGYDREMLQTYIDTVQNIQDLQTDLEAERDELQALKDSFEQTKYDANAALSDVTARLAEYDIEGTEVQEVIEEYMSDLRYDVEDTSADMPDFYEPEADDQDASVDQSDENGSVSADTTASEEENTTAKNDSEVQTTTSEKATTQKATTQAPTTTTVETTTEAPTEPETEAPTEAEEDYYEPDYYVPISTYGYSTSDVYDLARVTYLEDGCVYPTGTYMSVYLCACTILNRANNWYGGSISSAIYEPGAYATAYKYTSWGGGELVINDITWAAVSDALAGCDPNPYYQCNGDWLADYGLTEYYRDPYTDEVFYYSY